jgi:hypothetical protein
MTTPGSILAPTEPAGVKMTVTPALAKAWLENNTRNRPLNKRDIEAYARDMSAGKWQYTAEAIKLSPEGVLLDGQNRLHAIIKSGVPIVTLVVFDVDPAAQEAMDTCRRRSAYDTLVLDGGYRNIFRLTAAAKLVLARINNRPMGKGYWTNSEVQDVVQANPDLATVINKFASANLHWGCAPRFADYSSWLFWRIDSAAATEFIEAMSTGAELSSGDPRLTLRRRFADSRGTNLKLNAPSSVSLIVRTWNAWRKGEQMDRILTASRSGPVPIPEPI